MPFYLEMSQNIKRHLKLVIFRFLQIFYRLTMKRKNYIQLDQLKKIKKTKSRLKRNIKIL